MPKVPSIKWPNVAQTSSLEPDDGVKERQQLRHVVVMVSYKEPLALMERTLDSVACQTVASQIIMVVAFEEREGHQALEAKEVALRKRYNFTQDGHDSGVPHSDTQAFAQLIFTRYCRSYIYSIAIRLEVVILE